MASSTCSLLPFSAVLMVVLLLVAPLRISAKTQKIVLDYYTQQQAGVNEFSNVRSAVPPAKGTSQGVGQQTVFNYPVTSGIDPATSTLLGDKRGTSTVASNTPNSTVVHTNSVLQYNDPSFLHGNKKGLSGTFMKQGQADFGSGDPWQYAVTGGTGDFSRASGFTVGRQVDFTLSPDHSAPRITIHYTTHLWIPN